MIVLVTQGGRAASRGKVFLPCHVFIDEAANHLLILRMMPLGFLFEEIEAALAERNRYLDGFFLEGELFR